MFLIPTEQVPGGGIKLMMEKLVSRAGLEAATRDTGNREREELEAKIRDFGLTVPW